MRKNTFTRTFDGADDEHFARFHCRNIGSASSTSDQSDSEAAMSAPTTPIVGVTDSPFPSSYCTASPRSLCSLLRLRIEIQ